jgi:hypothetical protein
VHDCMTMLKNSLKLIKMYEIWMRTMDLIFCFVVKFLNHLFSNHIYGSHWAYLKAPHISILCYISMLLIPSQVVSSY